MGALEKLIASGIAIIAGISPALALDVPSPPQPRQWNFGTKGDGKAGFVSPNTKDAAIRIGKCAMDISDASKSATDADQPCSIIEALTSSIIPFLTLDASLQTNFWQPDVNGFEIVDYDTTGFKGYKLEGKVGLMWNHPVIQAKYEAPFEGASRQRDLLRPEIGKTQMGMEEIKLAGELASFLGPAFDSRFRDEKYNWPGVLVHTLGSFKAEYKYQSFFGSAKANNDIAIVGAGASRQGNVLTGGVTPLNPGQAVAFRTDFETVRGSIDLLAGVEGTRKPNSEVGLRVGYFDTRYRRPTVNGHPGIQYFICSTCGPNRRYLLFDTTFQSRGLMLGFNADGRSKEWEGGIGGGLDIGIDNDVKVTASAIDLYPKGVNYVGGSLSAYLRYKFYNEGRHHAFLAGEAEISSHSWYAGKFKGDADLTEKLALKLGFHF